MKKNYILTLILTLCFSFLSFGQGSETFSGATFPTSYSDGSFDGAEGITWTYVQSRDANGDANSSGINLPALMLRRVSSDSKITSSTISGGIGDFSVKLYKGFTGGGDRQVELFINGESKGTSIAFDDFNEHIFSVSGINVTGDFTLEIRNTTGKQVILDDITWTAPSSDVTLSIISPTDNQVFSASTVNIPVNFNIANFTLSGDNGSEMSDNTGDGYISGLLTVDGVADGTKNVFDTSTTIENVNPGSTYTITAELVDNTGVSLFPKVEATVTFSVELPCDIDLGAFAKTCLFGANDSTYDISIPFTGGNTSTYTITADSGTVGGDDPSTNETGTITITGVVAGTDVAFTLKGDAANSNCDISTNISSPTCIPLPISEDFSYADGSLIDNPLWDSFSGASGDLMVTSGQVLVQHGTPSEDAQLQFSGVSGSIYYAFDFTVVDPGNPIPGDDNEYFAMFKDVGFNYRARLDIVPPTSSGDFSVGISTKESTADSVWATDFSFGVTYRATVMYNQDTNIAQLWIDAALDSDTSILGNDLDDPGLSIEGFAFRQSDSNLNEGILVDNLRIGTTFADTVLSVGNIEIEGFATYPNPVNNGQFTINSNSNEEKEVSIYNVLGKKVFVQNVSGTKSDIDVSFITSGVYILKVIEGNKTATSKLVIK